MEVNTWTDGIIEYDLFECRQPDDANLLVGRFQIVSDYVRLTVYNRSGRVVHRDFMRIEHSTICVEVPPHVMLMDRCPAGRRPDVAIVDRYAATQFGLLTCTPTIGMSNVLHRVDGLSDRDEAQKINVLTQFHTLCTVPGRILPLVGASGQVWGAAVNTGARMPVYISVGHRISIDTAVELVLAFSIGKPLQKKPKSRTSCF